MERLSGEPDSATYSPGVDRALEILERLGASDGGLTLSELSARLGFPKNAVFRITNTLKARGYLARDEKTLRFRLTEKLLRLSQPRVEGKGLLEASMAGMRALRDECRETVQIGRRFGDEGVILEQVEGLHPLRISVDPGLRFPLHNNAPGKLLLAFLPDAARAATLKRIPMPASTPRTLTDRHELARECERIREQGWSVDFAEADEGIHCVAAPIVDPHGELLAALWISAPSRRLPRAAFAEAGAQVKRAAARISEDLRTP
ncbi:MAG: IclR family transcriptional regulator [Planctomycetaceae bacterium]|nr:IclR family transcriptional regulator [Planctomycetaceae bacterium]